MLLVNPLVSSESNHLSNKTINTNLIKSKRFQALDACRRYDGMFIFLSFLLFSNLFYCVQVVTIHFLNMPVSQLTCLFLSTQSFFSSVWNGLNLEDIVFPWFVWMISFSIVLSQRSLRAKKFRKRNILFKICRRTAILFVLGKNKIIVYFSTLSSSHSGLVDNDGPPILKKLEILSFIQQLGLCYFLQQ